MSAPRPDPATDLRAGDRVALLVDGSLRYVDAVLSLLVRGVIPIPLDPRLTSYERERILADLDPALVVTDAAGLEPLVTGWQPGDVPLARPMHVTSGTTGTPKGVDSGVLPRSHAEALLAEERDLWGFRADDVNLVLSPLYHSAPLRFAIGTLLAGGRVVAPGPFDPARVSAAIAAERPTTMFCVPAHLQRLFAHWDEPGDRHDRPDLSSFRLVAHAGAPCPDHLKERLVEVFPDGSTWEFYGSTEGQFTACRSEEWRARPGTVGRARPGRRMRADADGLLWCAVPEHARFSYFGAPGKTAAAWRDGPDGPEFTVGDLGRVDEDGYVYLDGRREDLVISGGVNVYPAEVENVLGAHPGVADVAVYGVPDPAWGQRLCAAVVGTVAAQELEEDLRAWATARLSPPKRPKDYRFLAEVPRTLTGKVLRRDLVAEEGVTPGARRGS
ncbi:class I adenylate-forming enzyme family protein [Marmoricola sp. RAF53]|uniref:class I adenylate-forming enzyme family protein n=1 Tax=Marmoricola sp. RAF53 TaxID=3233059 RepID=UPI003F979851